MAGINIVNNNSVGGAPLEAISTSPSTNRTDFNIDGALCQRELMSGNPPNAQRVQLGVKQVQKSANLQGKPAIIVHGAAMRWYRSTFVASVLRAEQGGRRCREQAELHRGDQCAALRRFPAVPGIRRELRAGARTSIARSTRCTRT
jgi:hypothetical protein